jgi:hypothetical protein
LVSNLSDRDDRAVADPFRPITEVLDLLRVRAAAYREGSKAKRGSQPAAARRAANRILKRRVGVTG